MRLILLPGMFNISKLPPDAKIPGWCMEGDLFSITRTTRELSVVCRQENVPQGIQTEPGWRCFEVEGPLDFSLTGILSSLTAALATAGVSLFAVSTFDTDYILVKDADAASHAFSAAGHDVTIPYK